MKHFVFAKGLRTFRLKITFSLSGGNFSLRDQYIVNQTGDE